LTRKNGREISRKEVALPAEGSNITAAKNKKQPHEVPGVQSSMQTSWSSKTSKETTTGMGKHFRFC
jgi:hypothetical protein